MISSGHPTLFELKTPARRQAKVGDNVTDEEEA